MTRFLAISIALALITLTATYPVVTQFQTHIPQGTEPASTVPLFNAWTLWWNLDRVSLGLDDYWNAPIFHPTQGTFAYSEPQPILMFLAPLSSLLNLPALYNFYLLLSLWLNGIFGYALFRSLKFSHMVAFCGGVLVETLPFSHWQLGVLQLIPLWGAMWVILSLIKLNDSPSYLWSVSLGGALAATYWCCNYYGVFLVVLLAPAGLILVADRLRDWRFWRQVSAAAVWFSLLVGPLVWGQLQLINSDGFVRNLERVKDLSAVPADYTRFPFDHPLTRMQSKAEATPDISELKPERWKLSPGIFSCFIAAAGFLMYLLSERYRAWSFFSLLFCAEAYLLSMGPYLDELGIPIYRGLTILVPGYSQIRDLFRFAVFVQLGCAFLGVLFLQLAVEFMPSIKSTRLRVVCGVTLTMLCGATIAERWPEPPRCVRVPWNQSEPGWCQFLREQTPADSALACFPFPSDEQASAFEHQTHWMLAISWHHRPIVNGYSGFLPESYSQISTAAMGGLDSSCLNVLREHGVRYCVLKESWIETSSLKREDFETHPGLQPVFTDSEQGIRIYELKTAEIIED